MSVRVILVVMIMTKGKYVNINICGEAYSKQGWVEGALTNAELMLKEAFDLKKPSRLPEDYYNNLESQGEAGIYS